MELGKAKFFVIFHLMEDPGEVGKDFVDAGGVMGSALNGMEQKDSLKIDRFPGECTGRNPL